MILHMVCIDEVTSEVIFGQEVDNPDDGPVRPIMPALEGMRFESVDEPFVRLDVPTTVVAKFVDGKVEWIETASLDDLRSRKSSEINAAWMAADSTVFFYSGEAIGAEADDIVRLNSINGYIGLMGAMPPGWPGVWKTKANTFISVPDVDAWKPFYTAFVMKGVTNYMAAQSLKAQVAAATTAAEIAAIAWPA